MEILAGARHSLAQVFDCDCGGAQLPPSVMLLLSHTRGLPNALKIMLNEAPLVTEPCVLLKQIEFQVTVDPTKHFSFFNLFSFELRAVGFRPSSDAFGGSHALPISGQVKLINFGAVVSLGFDSYQLWIAPPEQGKVLPRIRFDDLDIELPLGSMEKITGTDIAVDGRLQTLVRLDVLSGNALSEGSDAKGLVASESVNIQDVAPMSASMELLEFERSGLDERRLGFFLYLQRSGPAGEGPAPDRDIFLRKVGYGFGYCYTLAGIATTDHVESPRELARILD